MGKKRIIAGLDLYDDGIEKSVNIDYNRSDPGKDFNDIKFQDMTIGHVITLVGKYGITVRVELDNNGRPVVILQPPNKVNDTKNDQDEYDLPPIVRNGSRRTNLTNLWR